MSVDEWICQCGCYNQLGKYCRKCDQRIDEKTDIYICPRCRNGEHGPNAKYCRICGLKIDIKDGGVDDRD